MDSDEPTTSTDPQEATASTSSDVSWRMHRLRIILLLQEAPPWAGPATPKVTVMADGYYHYLRQLPPARYQQMLGYHRAYWRKNRQEGLAEYLITCLSNGL